MFLYSIYYVLIIYSMRYKYLIINLLQVIIVYLYLTILYYTINTGCNCLIDIVTSIIYYSYVLKTF